MSSLLNTIFTELLYRKKVESQVDFAHQLGYKSEGYISDLLGSDKPITLKMQRKLHDIFGISLTWMASEGKEGTMFPQKPDPNAGKYKLYTEFEWLRLRDQGVRLAEIRAELGLTPAELAHSIPHKQKAFSEAHINAWEGGEEEIDPDALVMLSVNHQVNPGYIVNGTEPKFFQPIGYESIVNSNKDEYIGVTEPEKHYSQSKEKDMHRIFAIMEQQARNATTTAAALDKMADAQLIMARALENLTRQQPGTEPSPGSGMSVKRTEA